MYLQVKVDILLITNITITSISILFLTYDILLPLLLQFLLLKL